MIQAAIEQQMGGLTLQLIETQVQLQLARQEIAALRAQLEATRAAE